MQTWEILEKAIPRGEAERIAKLMGCSVDTVRKWRREPESDDNTSSGRFNPLEGLMLLLDALEARYPPGADEIRDYINGEGAAGKQIRSQDDSKSDVDGDKELRAALQHVTDLLAARDANGQRKRVRS